MQSAGTSKEGNMARLIVEAAADASVVAGSTQLVNLFVSVTDAAGRPVQGLSIQNFQVWGVNPLWGALVELQHFSDLGAGGTFPPGFYSLGIARPANKEWEAEAYIVPVVVTRTSHLGPQGLPVPDFPNIDSGQTIVRFTIPGG
jgi:hypothetical protein